MTEGAVKVAVHRLREKYRAALRKEIAATVTDEADVDQEIAELFAALAN
jgi:RNA polymerase sigma-70 factor (ECF subfamily)